MADFMRAVYGFCDRNRGRAFAVFDGRDLGVGCRKTEATKKGKIRDTFFTWTRIEGPLDRRVGKEELQPVVSALFALGIHVRAETKLGHPGTATIRFVVD